MQQTRIEALLWDIAQYAEYSYEVAIDDAVRLMQEGYDLADLDDALEEINARRVSDDYWDYDECPVLSLSRRLLDLPTEIMR